VRRGHYGRARQFPRRHRGWAPARRVGEPRRRLHLIRLQGRHRLHPDHPAPALAAAGALREEGVAPVKLWAVVAALVLLALPLVGVDDYYLHLLIMAGLFYLLAAGMNLLLAAGQLNLGHTAFFGIRAHTSGLLRVHFRLSPPLTLPVAAALPALARPSPGPP